MLVGRGSDCGLKEKIVGTASGLSLRRPLVPGISSALRSRSKQSSEKCTEHMRLLSLIGGFSKRNLTIQVFNNSGFFSGSRKKLIPFDASSLRLLQP